MRALYPVCLALALAAPTTGHADQPYTVTPFHIDGTLIVGVDGRLVVGLSGKGKAYSEWTVSPGWRRGQTFLRPSEAGAYSKWAVGYDPKTRAVVLTMGDHGEVECAWRVVNPPKTLGLYLRAAAGKYEGWYLSVAEKVEKVTDKDGNPHTFHRLILTEKPGKRAEWDIEQIGK